MSDASKKQKNCDVTKLNSENVEFFRAEDFRDMLGEPSLFAALANRLLRERGTVVTGYYDEDGVAWFSDWRESPVRTHRALLIDVRQIPSKEDSAESLLREALEIWEPGEYKSVDDWVNRARRLLGAKEG
jgi:hypothetical protein